MCDADGEDLADKVGNVGDEARKDLGNTGDDLRHAEDHARVPDDPNRPMNRWARIATDTVAERWLARLRRRGVVTRR